MIILQGFIARFVWNHRRALRKLKTGPIKDMSIIIRLAFFVLWEMVGLIFNLSAINTGGVGSTFLAALPLSVFLTFSTQIDIFRVWFSWLLPKRSRNDSLESKPEPIEARLAQFARSDPIAGPAGIPRIIVYSAQRDTIETHQTRPPTPPPKDR
ncbi:hypothetical protein SISSUDRAFT_1045444 [Sistotremastrum suecicum HHB10207 ss-3]|uniref:Uncharacterized protein n=1 Tax=Sistotremastrum suecicum HHB10207 ss-3 TaxID=1314776 RepID=A0A166EGI1_9AGAM|nr:hypothetical protein SISSUDRAFT_1045444 [Sistotremastrum suecicum HHB10207 ss-3]